MSKRTLGFVLALGLMVSMTANASATEPTGKKNRQMVNCPSAYPGAATVLKDTKDGYEVVVTAKGPNAVRQIRARARTQESARAAGAVAEHTGEGTGVGSEGFCPILHTNTQVSVKDIEGGVKITVKSKDKAKVEEHQKLAKDRLSSLQKS